jgi:hypothetical protein
MSTQDKKSGGQTGQKPARSPVERAIVWGVILLGLVVLGVEARARLGYTTSLNALTAALKAAEESAGGESLSLADAEKVMAMFPRKLPKEETGLYSIYRYSWNGFFKEPYVIELHCLKGDKPQVAIMKTPNAEEPPPPSPPASGAGPGPAGGGPPGFGPPGGGAAPPGGPAGQPGPAPGGQRPAGAGQSGPAAGGPQPGNPPVAGKTDADPEKKEKAEGPKEKEEAK